MPPRKKKSPKPLTEAPLDPWRMVVFTDLHVSSKTLDRAIEVLRRVRATAREYEAGVVCLGDFWHQRGHLSVRHLDLLLDEFSEWRGIETIFVPGNHDQVTVNGQVHGVRVFEAFPSFHVATEPLLWKQSKLAFLPWREEPGAQAQLFSDLDGAGWTVFAHAEVKGATTNGAHIAPGRVTTAEIEQKARACYLGHYHKRQKLGKHTWYIGSPFEMNFGERDMPHGIAIVEEGRAEPHFIDFDDMPKHHRLVYGGSWNIAALKENDVVEVVAPMKALGTERLGETLASLGVADVRTVVAEEEADPKAPPIAMGLDEAILRYVEDTDGTDLDHYRIRQLGREILAEVPEARTAEPIAPRVDLLSVDVENFCGVRGRFHYDFPDGVTLIRGPMGSGKTSLMDATTWAFFGQTTPRKAGSHGASLRADEVIHDEAAECAATVALKLEGRSKPVTVTRQKARGSGAKVKVQGIQMPEGISDQQDLVHAVLGVSPGLWRTCVYLGQGAVGNFVTDADKKRKELLSAAFGLDACPAALEVTRTRLRALRSKIAELEMEMAKDERAIEVMEETDYREQIAQWEEQRKATLEVAQQSGEEAKKVIAQCEAHLKGEADWLKSKTDHETHLDQLTKSLASANPQNKAPELIRQLGAAEAERAQLDAEEGRIRAEIQQHVAGPGACPTCGRPFDENAREQHIQQLEAKIQNLGTQKSSFNARIANLQQQLTDAQGHNDAATKSVQTQIEQTRETLSKIAEALNTMAVLKSNRAEAERRLSEARIEYVKAEKEVNPFLAKQTECEAKVQSLKGKQAADRVQMDAYEEKQRDLEVWEHGFGPKGVPVIVLRGALYELENYANQFMNRLLHGRVFCRLAIDGESLAIRFFEVDPVSRKTHERRYEQLSGGQRRCVELAFNPFALGEMVFNRAGVRIDTLIVDELTTHLDPDSKAAVCELLETLERRSITIIDHDVAVQSSFDQVWDFPRPQPMPEAEAVA